MEIIPRTNTSLEEIDYRVNVSSTFLQSLGRTYIETRQLSEEYNTYISHHNIILA